MANLDITREAKSYSQQLADREFGRRTQEAGLYGQQYGVEQGIYQNEQAAALEQQRYEEQVRREQQQFEIDQQNKLKAARIAASAGGGDSLAASIAQVLANKTQPTIAPQTVPMIGNIPLSDLQNDVIYGRGGQVSFNTDAGMLTREQLVDYLTNNTNGEQGRQTQGWQSVYKQVMDNFKEKRTSPQQTEKSISSFISIPGQKSTNLRGF
jgi:hypothetical protein